MMVALAWFAIGVFWVACSGIALVLARVLYRRKGWSKWLATLIGGTLLPVFMGMMLVAWIGVLHSDALGPGIGGAVILLGGALLLAVAAVIGLITAGIGLSLEPSNE